MARDLTIEYDTYGLELVHIRRNWFSVTDKTNQEYFKIPAIKLENLNAHIMPTLAGFSIDALATIPSARIHYKFIKSVTGHYILVIG